MEAKDWKEFATITISTNDLDPTYQMLYHARTEYGDDWVARFCLHMLMFYHIGEAADAAFIEGDKFWEHVQDNYETCKRGTERRHFRGEAGRRSISSLIQASGNAPQGLLARFHSPLYPTLYRNISSALEGFGAYFIWKWADYLDSVFLMPIDYNGALPYMPDQPIKCAKKLWPNQSVEATLSMVVDYISQMDAPPSHTRKCDIPEAETILCMLKGYFITHSHKIGDDIDDKHKALGDDPYNLARFLPPRIVC